MQNQPFYKNEFVVLSLFSLVILAMPLWLEPIGADYPDLLQKFVIYGIFATGFNILFGLTGYLSFGHAAFLGIGSYAAMWSFKLLTMNVIPAVIFAVVMSGVFALAIGYVSLKRSGIYFSILTLAFAQMCYATAYSVLTPITNGETGLQLSLKDPRILDSTATSATGGLPFPSLFGITLSGYAGFYFSAVMLIICFFIARRIFLSPFGLMLGGIKSNQNRMRYTGFNTKPYTLAAFVISGMFAGLAGALLVVTDPLAGAERMQWTASGEVVLMTILGGAGTLVGPLLGAGLIKYFENIFSAVGHSSLEATFAFLPAPIKEPVVSVLSLFVGDGWRFTLGALFMAVVIFLPGGIMEGLRRITKLFSGGRRGSEPVTQPAE